MFPLKSFALAGVLLLGSCVPGVGLAAESNLLANGGFETVGRLSRQRLSRLSGEGLRFENEDPLLPMRWDWTASGGPAELRLVPQAHSGRQALRVVTSKGATLHLSMGVIEVVPNATYGFGAWIRGRGKGAVVVQGHAFEGPKELSRFDVEPTASWTETRGRLTIPTHVRTVTVELVAAGEVPKAAFCNWRRKRASAGRSSNHFRVRL